MKISAAVTFGALVLVFIGMFVEGFLLHRPPCFTLAPLAVAVVGCAWFVCATALDIYRTLKNA